MGVGRNSFQGLPRRRGGEWEIIILWKKRFGKITPVAFSHFTLYLVISSDKSKDWIMSVVYNAQNFHVQHDAWNSLS